MHNNGNEIKYCCCVCCFILPVFSSLLTAVSFTELWSFLASKPSWMSLSDPGVGMSSSPAAHLVPPDTSRVSLGQTHLFRIRLEEGWTQNCNPSPFQTSPSSQRCWIGKSVRAHRSAIKAANKRGGLITQWAMTYFGSGCLPGGRLGCVSADGPGLHPRAVGPAAADWHRLQNPASPSRWRPSLCAELVCKP